MLSSYRRRLCENKIENENNLFKSLSERIINLEALSMEIIKNTYKFVKKDLEEKVKANETKNLSEKLRKKVQISRMHIDSIMKKEEIDYAKLRIHWEIIKSAYKMI